MLAKPVPCDAPLRSCYIKTYDLKAFNSFVPQKNTPFDWCVFDGGDTQNRTEDEGVADPCLTAWLCRHIKEIYTRYKFLL